VPGHWIESDVNLFNRTAANSWITLFGDFPGVPAADWSSAIAPDGSLPTSLGGVTAAVSGIPCVLAYVDPDRMDLLLPAGIRPGSQTLAVTWPAGEVSANLLMTSASPAFLSMAAGGELYPAALTADFDWITPANPAHPGQILTLYVTGVNLTEAVTPPFDSTQPGSMQLVLNSYGYPVLRASLFSPGVAELTVQIPADAAPGNSQIRIVAGGILSIAATVLPVAR